jgi:hypothetical protein
MVSIIGSPFPKKNFLIVSNNRLKTFFLLKTIDLIDVFYSSSIIGIGPIDVFCAIGAHLFMWCVLIPGFDYVQHLTLYILFTTPRYNYNVKTCQNFKSCRELGSPPGGINFSKKFAPRPLYADNKKCSIFVSSMNIKILQSKNCKNTFI